MTLLLRSLIAIALSVLFLQIPMPVEAMVAQDSTPENGISIHGPVFHPTLEGLEETYTDYLHAWGSEDASVVLNYFAQDITIFTRDGVQEDYADVQEVLSLVVPHLRIRGTRIHLLDLTEGLASIGEVLEMNDVRTDGETSASPRFGPTLTVWERGPDLRWRVVFIAAPWIGPRLRAVLGQVSDAGPPAGARPAGAAGAFPH